MMQFAVSLILEVAQLLDISHLDHRFIRNKQAFIFLHNHLIPLYQLTRIYFLVIPEVEVLVTLMASVGGGGAVIV